MKKRTPRIQTAEIHNLQRAADQQTQQWNFAPDRLKAHELYEQRGREEGHALEDWLKAEAIITRPD